MIKKVVDHFNHAAKGQSFVELALVSGLILFLLVGMIEFGYMLNNYIGVTDAAREGARAGSVGDPFHYNNPGWTPVPGSCGTFEQCIDVIVEGSGTGAANDRGALSPMQLDPTTDDVVITYYSVLKSSPIQLLQFPQGKGYWCKYCNHTPEITQSFLLNHFDGGAPSSGILVVEIFYAYHQLLKMPILNILDPIETHTYAIMPLSAAEPTPTPCTSGSC